MILRAMARAARLRRGLTTLVGLTVLVVGAGPAWALGSAPARATPADWDPRVLPLVQFVQHARGLTFKHPVPVHFLSPAAFQQQDQSSQGALSKGDRHQLELTARELDALGLAQVDANTLFTEANSVDAADTLAFYDDHAKAVFIKGTTLDLDTRVTVAHELTHVLQDQYFNLPRIKARAVHAGSEAVAAATSLIEGDAVTVEDDYVNSLSQSEQNLYNASQNQQAAAAEGALPAGVPALFQAAGEAPYDIGPTFVEALLKHGGHAAVNAAFQAPPTTVAEVLDPARYLTRASTPRLATPALQPGEVSNGTDTLGALGFYYLLASRLDPIQSLRAADAWGNDRLVSFQRGGTSCVRVAIVGVRPSDTRTILGALQRWSQMGPAGTSSVTQSRSTVVFDACQPATGAVPASSVVLAASTDLAARASLVSQAIDGGLDASTALCTANVLVADPSVVTLLMNDNPSNAQIDDFMNKVHQAVATCTR